MSQQHSTGSALPSADKSLPPLQSQHGTEHPVAGGLLSPGPASSNSEPAVISGSAGGLDISRQDGTGHPVAGGLLSPGPASSNSKPAVGAKDPLSALPAGIKFAVLTPGITLEDLLDDDDDE
ncbi:hypothetical protein GPALN_012633 [Globodera pallida]|nr:hypothetical protein GPALN_012633 [Globodera pallida]